MMRFSRNAGYDGMLVVNLFAWRTAEPKELRKAPAPVGAHNDDAIRWAMGTARIAIAAWGAEDAIPGLEDRIDAVLRTLEETRGPGNRPGHLFCLGTTASGRPRHPLYVAAATRLRRWKPNG